METTGMADVVIVVHFAYVGFVLFGYVAVTVGWARGWRWVRNRLFRLLHLAAIGLVAVEAAVGIVCPLTWLESYLRPGGAGGSFVGRIVQGWLYYDWPGWAFTAGYMALFALALWLYWVAPPRRRGVAAGWAVGGGDDAREEAKGPPALR